MHPKEEGLYSTFVDDAGVPIFDPRDPDKKYPAHVVYPDKIIPVSAGIKYDAGKPDMSLLSSIALTELTKVLDFGAKKYSSHNWRKGITSCRLIAAALRHLFSYLGGETNDPETSLNHVAHAMCCCMFIIELKQTHPQLDDRYGVAVIGVPKKHEQL